MEDIKMAYCEVDMILGQMEKEYVNKIPSKLRNLFKEQKKKDYLPDIKADVPLVEQKLMRKTIAILAMLNLNYWCEDEEEKQDLIQIYSENDKKREEELREKYNPDDLFKKVNKDTETTNIETSENNTNTALIEYKESFFTRFKNFIFKILHISK